MIPDQITSEWESFIQYGHFFDEVGWVIESRGKNYATHQRTVWMGPVEFNKWGDDD